MEVVNDNEEDVIDLITKIKLFSFLLLDVRFFRTKIFILWCIFTIVLNKVIILLCFCIFCNLFCTSISNAWIAGAVAEGEPVDGDRAVFAPTPSWPLCKAKYYVFLFCIFLCCTLYYLYIYIQPSLSFCFASQSVHFAGIALCSAHQQLVTKGRSHLRFSGFCPLRGPPPLPP